jgi:hypothetical protein
MKVNLRVLVGLALVSVLAVAPVSAAKLLGTENTSKPVGPTQTTRNVNIYEIDTDTCSATLLSSRQETVLPEIVAGDLATDNFNGNAFEPNKCLFYYSRYDRNTNDLIGNDPNPFFFDDLSGSYSAAGILDGGAAGGGFWNGEYYYVPQRSAELRKVTLDGAGMKASESTVCTFPLGGDVLAFGDLTFRISDGVLFGSATRIPGYKPQFYRVDNLDCNTYTVLSEADPFGAGALQIAFGLADNVLYGHSARNGRFYTIDTTDGTQTLLCNAIVKDQDFGGIDPTKLKLSDLTEGECQQFCEPDPRTQGYWHRQCLGVPESEGGIDPGRNGRGPQEPNEPGFVEEHMPCAETRLEDLGFYGLTTCEGMDADPASDPCEKAEKQLTALILNDCSGKLQEYCDIDVSAAGCSSTTVGDLILEATDLIFGGSCQTAADCIAGVNEGYSLPADDGGESLAGGASDDPSPGTPPAPDPVAGSQDDDTATDTGRLMPTKQKIRRKSLR